jgi:hypothetical protein
MGKRIATYESLVEQAAESLDAWRALQAVHAIKANGGTPEIRWNRKSGFSVVDLSDTGEPEAQRLVG